jgi:hypothetical protein
MTSMTTLFQSTSALGAEHAILHDLARAELVPAMDDVDLGGELREVARLLHRGVAAPDDRQRLVAEHRQRAVADGARAHAAADLGEAQLVLEPEPVRGRAGRDDHRVSLHRLALGRLRVKRPAREVAGDDVLPDHPRAEALGLLLEQRHHVRAGYALGKAGVVLDIGGQHELPAGQHRRGILLGHADVARRVRGSRARHRWRPSSPPDRCR